jgi:hypothetical protein
LAGAGFLRWDGVLPCTVTRGIIEEMLPFDAAPVCILCSHKQLCHAFEFALSSLPEDSGRLPQLSGIRLQVNVSRPPLHRLVSAILHDKTVLDCPDDNRFVRVGSRTFDSIGGGYLFKDCKLCSEQPPLIDVRELVLRDLGARDDGRCESDAIEVQPLFVVEE